MLTTIIIIAINREEIERLELENRLQAERIRELELERARLHLQLLCNWNEPGQQLNAYRN